VFFNVAVVLRTVGGLWAHLDPRLEEAARLLGATRWRAFTTVTLPLLRPALAAAASLVFLFTFTSFGTVLLLGGPGLATLEVEIYRHTTSLFDLPLAAVLAWCRWPGHRGAPGLLPLPGAAQRGAEPAPGGRGGPPPGHRRRAGAGLGHPGSDHPVPAGPPAVLVARSLDTGSGWGLAYYRALGRPGRTGARLVDPLGAVGNSLGFAAAATALALGVGLLAAAVIAYRRAASRAGSTPC